MFELLLEQLALGEIDAEGERRLRARLCDAEIEARLSALREANHAFARRLDRDAQLEQIRAKCRAAQKAAERS